MNILCIDIGSGTQDVLYYIEGRELENCPKFILPSPAMYIFNKIKKLTRHKKNIFLYGHNMGGGFKSALIEHINRGYRVACSKDASFAISDNMDKVKNMGIEIVDEPTSDFIPVYLTDFDPGFWQSIFNLLELEYPDLILIAAQDHGFFPDMSNRVGRFKLWENFLKKGGKIIDLLDIVDERFTRLLTIKNIIGNGFVIDTGAAAVLGALFEEKVYRNMEKEGVCIINIGNSHTISFLIYNHKIYGIYEHHTSMLTGEKLLSHIQRFKRGNLTNKEVFDDMGHGCIVNKEVAHMDFSNIYVIGPKRALLSDYNVEFIAPGGDMMLTGAIGLLNGYLMKRNL